MKGAFTEKLLDKPVKRATHGVGGFIPPFPQTIKEARFRDGGRAITVKASNEFLVYGGWAAGLFSPNKHNDEVRMGNFMDLEEKALEASASVQKLVSDYMAKCSSLKSQLQNDSASIKASSERIEKEFARIAQAMRTTIDMMTSPQMKEALGNAERLAAALQAINGLQSNSITFAVIDKKPGADDRQAKT